MGQEALHEENYFFRNNSPCNQPQISSAPRIALGLSSSSYPLLQRLKKHSHADVVALTPGAASTFEHLPKELLVASASEIVRQSWKEDGVLLVVGSIGAVVRLISPQLKSKESDPAVVVLDAAGENVVPLIGGHKAGAEDLAIQLAELLGGRPVLTGDSRSQGRLALDNFGKVWGWKRGGDSSSWKRLMLQQAREELLIISQEAGSTLWQKNHASSISAVSSTNQKSFESIELNIGPRRYSTCSWHPATLWLGLGCERNTSKSLVERSLNEALKEAGLAQEAVAGLATIDLKSDEPAFLLIANSRDWPIRFFQSEFLSTVSVPSPSEIVQSEIGTPSVAEASALLAAGVGGRLLKEKKIYRSCEGEQGAVTIAIAEGVKPFAPSRGELHLVGSGPGDLALLTLDARFALARAAVWLGYEPYLDLLEPLRRNDQVRVNGQLTRERERCIEALELAVQGVSVALVSSGDSGIYGMAGLVLELLLELPSSDRPNFQVHPGISAFQMAAGIAGAPVMNDFCVVSLSDCLTPWEIIEKRLLSAAEGDFVTALYNPRSKDRDWQFNRAIEIMLANRAASTPVILARQIGRPGQTLNFYKLDQIPIDKVDMFTLVLIGNSRTLLKDGWVLTPRGYIK